MNKLSKLILISISLAFSYSYNASKISSERRKEIAAAINKVADRHYTEGITLKEILNELAAHRKEYRVKLTEAEKAIYDEAYKDAIDDFPKE